MTSKNKTLGIIHANIITTRAMEPYIQKYIPDVTICHMVDDTIQRDNIAAGVGVIPKVNYYKFVQYAHNLEETGVDLILLACSTFNYAAELARPMINTPIAQIDRPMMEEAVKIGHRVGLLATLETTVPSSERLLRIAAAEAGKDVEVKTVLCGQAFAELQKGNVDAHNSMLLEAIDKLSAEVDSIVMAQLSMSALALHLANTKVPVFNSGDTGFGRVKAMLENMR
ncbi:MAG: aspartate/glutamate racemase family protein [Defluviitaleaceae bacterium]|nr:aspartate/glutamate racemase family protein [Defluviitaleaceae bacterium]